MKNPRFWLFVVLALLVFSALEIYPPTGRSLIQSFQEKANPQKMDATFKDIVSKAQAMQKTNADPHAEFGQLMTAIGTNDIRDYFYYDVTSEKQPTYAILNRLQREAAGRIKLGLDLQGGFQVLVSLSTNKLEQAETTTNGTVVKISDDQRKMMVEHAVEVLRKRVDKLGVAEPLLQPAGENHILIQLPGLSEAAQREATNNIQKAAYLQFRMVSPESASATNGIVEPGYEILQQKVKQTDGSYKLVPLLVEKKLANGLDGRYIKRARPNRDPVTGAPIIEFSFNSEGAQKFGNLTTDNVGRFMAIVLDGDLVSAPVIREPIIGGNGEISGNFDLAEAYTIANALENPLETPVRIEAMSQVDPTLGKDTIRSGIYSAIYGTLFVALFMMVYYHRAGMIANIAMVTNLIILLGVMCSLETTLTLPGIAGIVLTVGMAVDANVLIYERLREEMAAGKSMRGAVAAAYDRAFNTIFDSHTTTLISAIILIYEGTGPIKGFGVTLTIGVALSLFTALVVTRLIFDFLLNRSLLNRIGMLHLIRNNNWDFMRWAKPAFITSWTIILVGIGYGCYRGHNVLGIDFAGGDAVTMSYNHRVEQGQVSASVKKAIGVEPEVQYQRGNGVEFLHIVVPYGQSTAAIDQLVKDNPSAGLKSIGVERVGATVGEEIERSAILASFLSLFGILIYVAFRYEFSFSVGAVLAVIHDVLMTLGIFFLAGKQLSAPIVAAILTIIGFSINDTIVIFDRIREDLKLGARGTFKDVMNKALNQTLSRTLITSGTVFIATMSLFIWGGGAIHDFAFTFLVGIITGTYSSIYIASALVLWWHKGERPKTASQVVMDNVVDSRLKSAAAKQV